MLTRITIIGLLMAALSMASCAGAPPVAKPASTAEASAAVDASDITQPATPAHERTRGLSAKAIAYAKGLGGVSQSGSTLYFVIGTSVGSERQAQAALDAAIPLFGDMQSYFVIQRSDNFDSMTPGYWVLIEAYEQAPSIENLQFAKRAFPDAYVKRAKVLTPDPIPVYEQVLNR